MIIAAKGLRISECLGLQWADVDYDSQQIFIRRSWTGGKVGKPKSAASMAPVPLVRSQDSFASGRGRLLTVNRWVPAHSHCCIRCQRARGAVGVHLMQ